MSKSGLYAHFGSKEELQLATVDTAREIFEAEVVRPTETITDPLSRLEALCGASACMPPDRRSTRRSLAWGGAAPASYARSRAFAFQGLARV